MLAWKWLVVGVIALCGGNALGDNPRSSMTLSGTASGSFEFDVAHDMVLPRNIVEVRVDAASVPHCDPQCLASNLPVRRKFVEYTGGEFNPVIICHSMHDNGAIVSLVRDESLGKLGRPLVSENSQGDRPDVNIAGYVNRWEVGSVADIDGYHPVLSPLMVNVVGESRIAKFEVRPIAGIKHVAIDVVRGSGGVGSPLGLFVGFSDKDNRTPTHQGCGDSEKRHEPLGYGVPKDLIVSRADLGVFGLAIVLLIFAVVGGGSYLIAALMTPTDFEEPSSKNDKKK